MLPETLTTGPDRPTKVIVHLPGWGDRAAKHLDLVGRLADASTAVVVAEPVMGDGPRRWYDVDDDGPRLDQVATAVASVRALIDDLTERYSLAHTDITLIGFSQGGALALAVATGSDGGSRPGAVACLGGYLLARDQLELERVDGLPALVAHGVDDEMVETLRGRAAAKALVRGRAVVQWCEVDGGHVLDGPLLPAVADWIIAVHGGDPPSAPV